MNIDISPREAVEPDPPHISTDLVEYLQRVYAGRRIGLHDNDRTIGFKLGEQEVVNHLLKLHEDQRKPPDV